MIFNWSLWFGKKLGLFQTIRGNDKMEGMIHVSCVVSKEGKKYFYMIDALFFKFQPNMATDRSEKLIEQLTYSLKTIKFTKELIVPQFCARLTFVAKSTVDERI